MRIGVYAIARDEGQFVDRWAESVADADVRVVVDTGSSDDTVARLVARGDVLVSRCTLNPFRYDAARNVALGHVPADVDVCLVLDMDEVMAPGWRAALEAAWRPETTRLEHVCIASHGVDGSDGCRVLRRLCHRRFGYRWVAPCHETLVPEVGWPDVVTPAPGLVTHHWPDFGKDRRLRLDLLRQGVAENPQDGRLCWYLGRDLLAVGEREEARRWLEECLRRPSWPQLRSEAWRLLAQVSEVGADASGYAEREALLLRSVAEDPLRREPWLDLARLYADAGRWTEAAGAAQRGLRCTDRNRFMAAPWYWSVAAVRFAATCGARSRLRVG